MTKRLILNLLVYFIKYKTKIYSISINILNKFILLVFCHVFAEYSLFRKNENTITKP